MAVSSIQISTELKEVLKDRKFFESESYEDIIWNLLEDTMELSNEAKKAIKEAEEDVKNGRVYSLKQLKEELNL